MASHSGPASPVGVIPKTATDAFIHLLQESKYSDMTFIVGKEKKRVPCHSVFLMARSCVFEAELGPKLCGAKPIEVVMNDVSPNLFDSLLKVRPDKVNTCVTRLYPRSEFISPFL